MLNSILSMFKTEKKFKSINVVDAKELIKAEPNIQILDVRTQAETQGGMINKAKNNDFFKAGFAKRLDTLSKDKAILVYCRSGNRSRSACSILASNGFENIYNLNGGYTQWR